MDCEDCNDKNNYIAEIEAEIIALRKRIDAIKEKCHYIYGYM